MNELSQEILPGTKHITSLATAAVIVDLRETVYTGQHSDSKMADKVSADEGAKTRALKISHDLFVGDKDLHNLLTSRQSRYNWLVRNTYPWAGSLRLLEARKLVPFMKEFEAHKASHAALVDKFASNLNDKIAAAAFLRGPMFKRDDYPTEDQVRGAFTLRMAISEVPSGDFRVQISRDLHDELKALFTDQAMDYLKNVNSMRTEKLKKLMTSISNSCTLETTVDADGNTKVKRKNLHTATVENAIELCDEIKRFSPVEDEQLNQVRAELASILDGINVDALRESDTMRAKLKNEVDDILAKF